VRRSLIHYWRAHLAVVACCAVAAAVLTGALVVGDSVRGSLRDLTLERLGSIDHSVRSPGGFTMELATRLRGELGPVPSAVAPAILLRGSARRPETGALAAGVSVQGVGDDFFALFPSSGARAAGGVVVNQALASELDVEVGDAVLIAVERPGDAPRETLYGSDETADVVRSLRLEVVRVLDDRGIGRFSLDADQTLPLLAFVDLAELQEALGWQGFVNTLLIDAAAPSGRTGGERPLDAALRRALAPEDLGLRLEPGPGYVALESRDFVFAPPLEDLVERYAAAAGAPALAVSAYLANRLEARGRTVPYSAIAALDPAAAAAFGGLPLAMGGMAPPLADGEVLINEWLADELRIGTGAPLAVTYFEVGPREELLTRERTFTVRGVVALEGLGADAGITPDFPGIADADDMAAWDPPFPVDLEAIRPRDEAYWDRYRATPKAFFAPATAALWTTRFGATTSIRLAADRGASADELMTGLRHQLPRLADPAALGFRVDAVRERGLQASAGATDFRWLFLGFSSFLIGSAAILVALFFTLGIEQRASEIGLLLATGFPVRAVRRRFLAEGLVLAALGIAAGAAGAALYAAAMIAALRTWWRSAVGTPYLFLHLEPATLAAGAAAAFVVVTAAIVLSLRRLGRLPVVALLRGATTSPTLAVEARAPRSRWIWRIAAVAAAVLLGFGAAAGLESSPALFFAAGAALLVAGLAFFALRLRRPRGHLRPGSSYLPMAARNVTLHPGRSLLSAALVAAAAFVIVAVAANGFRYGEEVDALDSPAGGYTVVAESAVPVEIDLAAEDAAFEIGFDDRERELLASSAIAAFRVLPGDDVSCLNLYQPERPRILGVPPAQIERGGFRFRQLAEEREHPWTLLDQELDGGAIPAFGDYESMTWILKLGLGDELEIVDERGQTVRLRLVGLLEKSLFQSELLIAEERFERHFPGRTGRAFFLFDPPSGRAEELEAALEDGLDDYGLDATSTRERLDRYQAVFNTYLATFQTLGGLGLLLGTLGLAAILLRNVLERRGELATLRAFGFPRSSLAWLVLVENTFLLLTGLAIGAGAALAAVGPHLVAGNAVVPWGSLLATLVLIVAVGTAAAVAAVRRVLRAPLLPALKGD
jgi:ABC-type lipoprotein release transport system permease subunit